jgi:predicted nuclease with TOPRIM domain
MSARDRLKLLGDRADELTRYQAVAEEEEERLSRVQEAEKERSMESRQVASLRSEIADLRARLDESDQTTVRLADTIDILIDKTPTWVEKMIEARVLKSEAQMYAKIGESFGELRGWISAIDPALARATKGETFRFASEKSAGERDDEPVDLPNWRRGNGTVIN